MDQFNIQLFMALNAPAGLHGLALIIPVLIEKYLIFAVPVLMIFEWLWSETSQRNQLVVTLIAILFSLKLAQFAGHHWFFPRPDVLGIGHTYLAHSANSSFPSVHLTIVWIGALGFLMHKNTRNKGLVLIFLGFIIAWDSIYLGIHYPIDIMGAIVIATGSIILVKIFESLLAYLVTPWLEKGYRFIFRSAINKGWFKP